MSRAGRPTSVCVCVVDEGPCYFVLGEPPQLGVARFPKTISIPRARRVPLSPRLQACWGAGCRGWGPIQHLFSSLGFSPPWNPGCPGLNPYSELPASPTSAPARRTPTGPRWPRSEESPSRSSRRPWPLLARSRRRRLHRRQILTRLGAAPAAGPAVHEPPPARARAAALHGSGWRCGSGSGSGWLWAQQPQRLRVRAALPLSECV